MKGESLSSIKARARSSPFSGGMAAASTAGGMTPTIGGETLGNATAVRADAPGDADDDATGDGEDAVAEAQAPPGSGDGFREHVRGPGAIQPAVRGPPSRSVGANEGVADAGGPFGIAEGRIERHP